MATEDGAGALSGPAGRVLVVEVPMPDHGLTLNSRLHWRERARLVALHRTWAAWAGTCALRGITPTDGRYAAKPVVAVPMTPRFPAWMAVRVDVRVARRKGGRRWDDSALIEACKAYMDGLEDAGVYDDDMQVRWGAIEWDERPTGRGVVTLTLTAEGG